MNRIRVIILALILAISCFAAPYGKNDVRNNYFMHFYPEPNDGSCIITSIIMKPYKVTINQYGYKDIKPKYKSEIKLKSFQGVFEFLQAPYLPNEQWNAIYHYKKKVIKRGKFGDEVSTWFYGSGKVKNIPEGKSTIYLPCRGAGFYRK